MVCQWSRGSMPVRSCRQPWGMKSPKRMRARYLRSGARARSARIDAIGHRCPRLRANALPPVRMRNVLQTWTSAQVRAAEEPLLALGVPLMERAAFALHVRIAAVLRELRGAVAGARVV